MLPVIELMVKHIYIYFILLLSVLKLSLKEHDMQNSGQTGQNLSSWKNNKNTTRQANWGM